MNVKRDDSSAPCGSYLIPDHLCGKTGINATWMAHGKLGVYAYLPVNAKSRDVPSPNAPCNPAVHHMSFDSMLFDPVVRKLVNESCGVFIQGQKLAIHSVTEAECRQSLLKLSRQYRSIVRACLENVQDLITASKDQCDQYKHYIAILYNIELVWHLCEILYVDVVRGDAILPQLMEWISFHFPQCERRASAIFEEFVPQVSMRLDGVDNVKGAEEHADYWDVIIGVLLQGRVDVTRALLQIHSAAETTPFKMADRSLRTMPLYNVYGGISVSVFNSQWNQWQSEVRRQVEDGNFASNKKLEFIMKIMAGDEAALEEIKSHCETWYQLMAAILFFTEPTVKSFDLSFHADRSMVRFGVANKLRHLDILIMALLEADLQQIHRLEIPSFRMFRARCREIRCRDLAAKLKPFSTAHFSLQRWPLDGAAAVFRRNLAASTNVNCVDVAITSIGGALVIRELQNTAENGWFAAHLTNLLFLCGRLNILDSNQVNVAQQLKEHVVLDYGTALMGHHSLWQVGVSYLDYCSEEGLARLEVLLCAIPLTSEMKALKIIDIAKKRKLHSVVITTSKVMARQYMRRGKLGNALTWALRSHDVTLTSYLGDQFLDRYLRDGKFEATDLLENLGSCMLVSDRLTFLGKFCEFHQLYRAGDLPAAANLLVSLLASKLPPKSFQITLLMDALPLIEAHEVVLSSNDTYILMSCLEELECVVQKGKLGKEKEDSDRDAALEEKLKIIRLSLARNLSRAIVLEGNEMTFCQNIGWNGVSA